VLFEGLETKATPQALIAHRETVRELSAAYEQLNASFGEFALGILDASTTALKSDDAGDATYNAIEDRIASLTDERDALAGDIKQQLDAAAFDGQPLDEAQAKNEIAQANSLIGQAQSLD
jgi:hypothetical protein